MDHSTANPPVTEGREQGGPLAQPLRRPAARKLRKPLGPFQTAATAFEHGRERPIQIVRLTPLGIVYRVMGSAREYVLPHGVAFIKALAIAAGANVDPRAGRSSSVSRGAVGGRQ